MGNRYKIFFLLLSAVIIVVAASFIPFRGSAEDGSRNFFGGKIAQTPAPIVTEKEELCTSGGVCYGEINTWASMVDTSCSEGTFSLSPSFPRSSTVTDYCVTAGADKRPDSSSIAAGKWILGFYSGEQSTELGICTCETPPYYYEVQTVSAQMAHVTLFGTSR